MIFFWRYLLVVDISESLPTPVTRIENIYGHSWLCWICNKWENASSGSILIYIPATYESQRTSSQCSCNSHYTICRDIPLTLARACIIFVVCTAYTTLWRHDLPWMLQWNSWFCHFFPHPNYYQKTLLISQSLVCLCSPYLYVHSIFVPHSLRSCGIFKKPLDHKYLHTSIVQYCLVPLLHG